jgi:hypothetical protein
MWIPSGIEAFSTKPIPDAAEDTPRAARTCPTCVFGFFTRAAPARGRTVGATACRERTGRMQGVFDGRDALDSNRNLTPGHDLSFASAAAALDNEHGPCRPASRPISRFRHHPLSPASPPVPSWDSNELHAIREGKACSQLGEFGFRHLTTVIVCKRARRILTDTLGSDRRSNRTRRESTAQSVSTSDASQDDRMGQHLRPVCDAFVCFGAKCPVPAIVLGQKPFYDANPCRLHSS